MSIDIDWSLLSLPSSSTTTTPETDLLATTLVQSLNATLLKTTRPSFIGPIHITSLDFGTVPPDVEIRDIRDVWRIFDEADEDEDEEDEGTDEEEYDMVDKREVGWDDGEEYERDGGDGLDDWRSHIHSIVSPRGAMSVASVGLGGTGLRNITGQGLLSPRLGGTPSIYSQPTNNPHRRSINPIHSPISPPTSSPNNKPASSPSTTPSNPVPSLQLHLRLSHTSDIHITLTTSLSINYPSPSFMSLPLKLSITGLTLFAPDLILAYSGERNRVHVCIVDDESSGGRLLPDLKIESEIGHADAHVLRNVGKVERFIADAVRKTLVDELVFPNFQTIAL